MYSGMEKASSVAKYDGAELSDRIKALHAIILAGDKRLTAEVAIEFIELRSSALNGEAFGETGSLEVFKLIVKRATGEMCPYRPGTFGFYTGRRADHERDYREAREKLAGHFGQNGYRNNDLLPCNSIDDLLFGIEVLFVLNEFRQRAIKGTGPATPPPAN